MRARARFSEPCADSNRSRCVSAAEGAPVDMPLIRGTQRHPLALLGWEAQPQLGRQRLRTFAVQLDRDLSRPLDLSSRWASAASALRAQAVPVPSGARLARDVCEVGRSVLTLDLSISVWSAKVKFVEGGGVAGMRLRAGRTVSFNGDQPQSTIVRFRSFISGRLRWLTLTDKHLPAPIFSRFFRAKRFLLDFSEISAVACLEAFIEVPVRLRRLERGGSRRSCARGEATDRESGCGQ
jgi:hypothetical protein